MARLSRNDVADISPDTGAQRTAEDIEQELRGAPPRTIPTAKRLPLDRIHVAEEVFQWRLATEDVGGKTGHTLALAQALEDNKKGLDPLVVWWGGSRFYLIEGHHRLAAYRTAKWSKPVPVIEFQGTLEEARLHALGGNVKDKLRMTGTEKSEAAWKLIKEKDRLFRGLKETKQVEEIATQATRGESTVWLMIKVWRAIQEQGADEDMTWGRALMWNEGRKPEPPEDDKAWIEQKAQKMAQELARAKVDWMREPEVTARALEMLHDGLMDTLTQEWTGLTEEGIAEGRKWQEEQEEQEETTF